MGGIIGTTKSIVYLGGMAAGAALVFIGWWLTNDPKKYTKVASGTVTEVKSTEKKFFERDGRRYDYWLLTIKVAYTADGKAHSITETYRVYDRNQIPRENQTTVDVRFNEANPADATTRPAVAEDTLPLKPILMIVIGAVVIVGLNFLMLKMRKSNDE